MRAWWFPLALGAVAIVNGLSGVHYGRGVEKTEPYSLSVNEDDGLAAPTREQQGAFLPIFRQYFALEEALGGAELVVRSNLDLPARPLQILGRVVLREGSRRRIGPDLERKLQNESISPPLLLAGKKLYLARELGPPWTGPLHVLASRDPRSLYVVSQEQLEDLGLAADP